MAGEYVMAGEHVRHDKSAGTIEVWDEKSKAWQVKKVYDEKSKSWRVKTAADTQSVRQDAQSVRQNLVESYMSLGLNEAESHIAAGVERGVRSGDINKSFDSGVKLGLYEGAKRLGMSDDEALVFADPGKFTVNNSPFLEAAKKS